MATDIEEHDRISSKKQHTLILQTKECNELDPSSSEVSQNAGPSTASQEDIQEERKRKLREWQAWQIKKASEDNSFNEMFFSINPVNGEYSLYEILTELNMENEAVSMAIQNHGLVCSANFSQPQSCHENFLFNCHAAERHLNLFQNPANMDNTYKRKVLNEEEETSLKEKLYDHDQQQDFLLEQAVAEAIKKKGLSALTVDYG